MMQNNESKSERKVIERRGFLAAASTTAAALSLPNLLRGQGISPAGTQAKAPAASPVAPNHTMIYVYLRGGPDGLAFLAPFGDADYAGYRPNLKLQLGVPLPSTHFASPYWVLSQALRPLIYPYSKNDLAFLPATGQLENNKSHFVAMDRMEFGLPDSSQPNPGPVTTGFMARHLESTNFGQTAPLRGLVSQKLATTSFRGAPKSLAVANPATFEFRGDDFMRGGLTGMNATQPAIMAAANNNSFAAIDYLNGIPFSNTPNGYPVSNNGTITTLGQKFKDAEEIIKTGLAPEVIEIDFGGWDTHDNQGPNLGGGMYNRMSELADAMTNFYQRLENFVVPGTGQVATKRCTVITIGEFGRRIQENTTFGTDHGNGGLVMAMGARVNGGRIYDDAYYDNWVAAQAANPPITPLTASADSAGDVSSLTDYRDVFAEAFTKMMGLSNPAHVYFPGYSLPTPSPNVFS